MLESGFQGPFAVVGNDKNEPHKTAMQTAAEYLSSLGHVVQLQTITPQDNIAQIISGLKTQVPAIKSLYVCSDMYLTVNSKLLNDEAHDTKNGSPYINTMFEFKEHNNKHGGNAWYGSNFEELFAKAAHYAHEIMSNTATASDLPNFIASLNWGGAAHISKAGKKAVKKAKKAKKAGKK